MSTCKDDRWAKQFGDFGEHLIMFLLGHAKNMRVAHVDHVGADVIATDLDAPNKRFAISVKSRIIGQTESKMNLFSYKNQEKLRAFANDFGLVPTVAFIFGDASLKDFHVFLVALDDLIFFAQDDATSFAVTAENQAINIRISPKYIDEIRRLDKVDYTHLAFDKLEAVRKWGQ